MATITLSHQALNAFNSSVDPIIGLFSGKTESDKLKVIKRQPLPVTRHRLVVEVSIDDIPEEASLEYEPYTILQNKINTLMEITGCTEREAQRMVLELL